MIVVAKDYRFFRRGDLPGSAFYNARWIARGLCGLADEFWNFKLKDEPSIPESGQLSAHLNAGGLRLAEHGVPRVR
jgi:hypothetical protein